GLNARRDLDLKRFFFLDAALAAAIAAGVADDAALAGAIGAGAHHAEKALLKAGLAGAAAGDAIFGLGSLFGTAAVAGSASLKPRDAEFFVLAGGSLFQSYLEVVAEIGTAANARTARAAAAEHIPKAEEVKDVLKVRKAGIEPAGSRCLMAKAVIGGPLLGIGEQRVCLGTFLELFFRGVLLGVSVRMELHRHRAVCPLYLNLGGGPRYAQSLVVISLAHRMIISTLGTPRQLESKRRQPK